MNTLHCYDPGVTTGYAHIDMQGRIIRMEHFHQTELFNHLLDEDFKEASVIIEDYRIFHGKQMAHTMTRLVTAEMIGAIRFAAYTKAESVTIQTPQNKQMGYKWMGINPTANHKDSHQWDALAHGIFFLVMHKYIEPPIKRNLRKFGEKKVQDSSRS